MLSELTHVFGNPDLRALRVPRLTRLTSARGAWALAILALSSGLALGAENKTASISSPDARFVLAEELVRDDFRGTLERWHPELEKGGTILVRDGELEIDVPGGCSLWLDHLLTGPVLISYDVTAIRAGGPNDRVSDLNCFWMARDARSPENIFATRRTGKFADYDQLQCYYVGLGGNTNTTTRFRRYIGQRGNRPLRPEHDLAATEFLLAPNVTQRIQLIAAGSSIGYYRDGRQLFAYDDPEPYTSGWFAFRTVTSHFRIKNFRVHRLVARETGVESGAVTR